MSYRDNNLDRDFSPSTPPPVNEQAASIGIHPPPSPIYQQPTAADQPEYWLRNLDVNQGQEDIPVNPRNPYDNGSRPAFDASGNFTFAANAPEIQEGGRYNPIYVGNSEDYEANYEADSKLVLSDSCFFSLPTTVKYRYLSGV